MAEMVRTTITIRSNQKEWVTKQQRSQKGWSLSGFIQDQIDELMHKDSNQLKRIISEKEEFKTNMNKQLDKEIRELKQRHEEQRKKEEQIQQRKQQAEPPRHYDIGR